MVKDGKAAAVQQTVRVFRAAIRVLDQGIEGKNLGGLGAQGLRDGLVARQQGKARRQLLSFPRSSVGTHPMALQRPVVSLP